MNPTIEIEHEKVAARGRYFVVLGQGMVAEMTYFERPDATIVIDHTAVPRSYQGRGIALELVKRAIDDARKYGFRIVPRCSYVALQFKRHPDWADLLAA